MKPNKAFTYEEFYRKNELSAIFDIFKVRAPLYNAK